MSKKYIYRVYLASGTIIHMAMTPNQAAYYAERYDVRVEPVGPAPVAPLGQVERGYGASAWRPRC